MTAASPHRVGLIGWPVEHSVSPAMQNAAFDALGMSWHYSILPTPPSQIGITLAMIEEEDFRGANVTVPHKKAVMPYLDEITETAQAIGAVNTIVVEKDRLIGDNTDAHGFMTALVESGFKPTDQHVLVLGAGGAAHAVVYALAQTECAIVIFNRTAARATRLSRRMDALGCGKSVAWMSSEVSLETADLPPFDMVVNATSVGMWPDVDASPWPNTVAFPSDCTVFDLVYNPRETRLMRQARTAGVKTVSGLDMLVHQGALAFQRWTGLPAPVGVMRAAAEDGLRTMRED